MIFVDFYEISDFKCKNNDSTKYFDKVDRTCTICCIFGTDETCYTKILLRKTSIDNLSKCNAKEESSRRDPARDLRWNICHITNPTVNENQSKTLKSFLSKLRTLFSPKFAQISAQKQ